MPTTMVFGVLRLVFDVSGVIVGVHTMVVRIIRMVSFFPRLVFGVLRMVACFSKVFVGFSRVIFRIISLCSIFLDTLSRICEAIFK